MRHVKPFGEITDYGKPADWNETTHGPCGSLPVRRVVEGAGPNAMLVMYSNWKPSDDELARLNAGAVVELCCCGVQPAVSVTVVPNSDPERQPPEEDHASALRGIRGAVARGWCADANREKVMDGDLAEAISQEIAKLYLPAVQA